MPQIYKANLYNKEKDATLIIKAYKFPFGINNPKDKTRVITNRNGNVVKGITNISPKQYINIFIRKYNYKLIKSNY